jgi:hypothetical protein
MMEDILQSVFDISQKILKAEPKHVTLNHEGIELLVNDMKLTGKESFYDSEPEQKEVGEQIFIEILKELVASSINYCYWYGAHNIRPNEVSSSSMYNHVNECFDSANHQSLRFENRIDKLIVLLSANRYPLLEERKRHLLELCEGRFAEFFAGSIRNSRDDEIKLFNLLVKRLSGFGSDMFLKRASLFFMQLNRKFGWFKDLMNIIHVPADYQVPKILRHFDCIRYSDDLSKKIFDGKLIEKHSLEELQIRAATVEACNRIQLQTGWSTADIDTYLWTKRKMTDSPFHLTITTDY